MKHHITKYTDDKGDKYAESWLQINFLRWCFCLSKKKISI